MWDGFNAIGNPGQFFGTNNIIGTAINDVTGVTNSAKQQYKANMALQKNAQDFAKWQMGNAHQMEVQDLKDAGLNPVLSANAGAGAGVGGGSTGAGVGMDPISMVSSIIGMINSTKQVDAILEKTAADITNETNKTNADITNQTNLTDADVELKLKEAGWTQKQIDHYKKYGVPMGATITKTYGGGTSFSAGTKVFKGSGSMNYNKSTSTPIGYKYDNSGGNVYISESQLSQGKRLGKHASGKVNSTRTITRKTRSR